MPEALDSAVNSLLCSGHSRFHCWQGKQSRLKEPRVRTWPLRGPGSLSMSSWLSVLRQAVLLHAQGQVRPHRTVDMSSIPTTAAHTSPLCPEASTPLPPDSAASSTPCPCSRHCRSGLALPCQGPHPSLPSPAHLIPAPAPPLLSTLPWLPSTPGQHLNTFGPSPGV